MTRELRQTVLAFVAGGLLLYALGTCNGKADSQKAINEANAYRLAMQARPQREAIARAERKEAQARSALSRAGDLQVIREAVLAAQLDSNRVLLAQARPDTALMRIALQRTTERADSLLSANRMLRDSLHAFVVATIARSDAMNARILTADSTAQAFQRLYEDSRCRIARMPCPSRKTVAVVSGGSVLILVLLIL